jgi:alginate O-acetyltransferase complex protein AlgI
VLFNSPEFILFFLPVTLLVYLGIRYRVQKELAFFWLVLASLFFYGWWDPRYVLLIAGSIAANYLLGLRLIRVASKAVLGLGVCLNLGFLGYYKYANFFVDNLANLTGSGWEIDRIILPLAISFFTFQQISYLVDTYQGKVAEHRFIHYCLFVTFFPQLIAGPIVHHGEMLPQFTRGQILPDALSKGVTIFIIGLFKKVVIADGIAVYSTPCFDAAAQGTVLAFADAWVAALAYTFQLYFDFSGYSDMAIGLGLMFGIKLPQNFKSPYKANSIIEFWRLWHMTLSRFLRDYLYIPLGGNQRGSLRRYLNLLITMLLGGLWHGANWTFVVWGVMHGVMVALNHGWRFVFSGWRRAYGQGFPALGWLGRALTFVSVVFGWVYFRADDINTGNRVAFSMLGGNGFSIPEGMSVPLLTHITSWGGIVDAPSAIFYLLLLLICVWVLPNTLELVWEDQDSSGSQGQTSTLRWQPTIVWGLITGCFASAVIACFLVRDQLSQSEFLYFNF